MTSLQERGGARDQSTQPFPGYLLTVEVRLCRPLGSRPLNLETSLNLSYMNKKRIQYRSMFFMDSAYCITIWISTWFLRDPLIDSTDHSVHDEYFLLSLYFVLFYRSRCLFERALDSHHFGKNGFQLRYFHLYLQSTRKPKVLPHFFIL